MWDDQRNIWAVRLGKTGQVIGVKNERLKKIIQIQLHMLDSVEWVTLEPGEDKLFNLPQGVEVRINMSTGLKEVRSATPNHLKPNPQDDDITHNPDVQKASASTALRVREPSPDVRHDEQ